MFLMPKLIKNDPEQYDILLSNIAEHAETMCFENP
jgi:hypothetical protein